MANEAEAEALKRVLERMTVVGMAADTSEMDLSEQRAVLGALRRRLLLSQPQLTRSTADEAQ